MLLCLSVGAAAVRSENAPAKGSPVVAQARQMAERGLAFLQKDAAEWRTTRKCASCHQGTMTVWALAEAKSQGYPLPERALADVTDWHKDRLAGLEKPRGDGPAAAALNTAALYTGLIAAAVPHQDAVSPADQQRIIDHLRRFQETDGAWLWSPIPSKNRPPPVFESDALVTVLSDVVVSMSDPAEAEQKSALRESRERAAAWLDKNSTVETVQVQAFRLFRDVRAGRPRKEVNTRIERLLEAQNKDGGWSPEKDVPSDAYATGQVLYFLSSAGVKPGRTAVQEAIAFLARNQQADGSWFVAPRAHPGEKPFSNPSPISYFGSAWATMALMRMAPLVVRSKR
jgi:hypothetical protein